jgi:hypothetical protein
VWWRTVFGFFQTGWWGLVWEMQIQLCRN